MVVLAKNPGVVGVFLLEGSPMCVRIKVLYSMVLYEYDLLQENAYLKFERVSPKCKSALRIPKIVQDPQHLYGCTLQDVLDTPKVAVFTFILFSCYIITANPSLNLPVAIS